MREKTERNIEIWRRYCGGETQASIARDMGISIQAISEICVRERTRLKARNKDEFRQELAAQLDYLRAQMAALVDHEPAPMYRGNEPVRRPKRSVLDAGRIPDPDDPADWDYVEDHSGRIAAADTLLRVHQRLSRLLGIDAPAEVQTTGTIRYVIEGVDIEKLT